MLLIILYLFPKSFRIRTESWDQRRNSVPHNSCFLLRKASRGSGTWRNQLATHERLSTYVNGALSHCVPLCLNQCYSFAGAFIYNWFVLGNFSFARFLPRLTITNKREITAIKRAFDRHVVIIFRCSYVNRNCVNNAYKVLDVFCCNATGLFFSKEFVGLQ